MEHWERNSNVKCFDHKSTFPDTQRHFRPAIEISRNIPIVRMAPELKKAAKKTQMLGFTSYIFDIFDSGEEYCRSPYVKSKGYRMRNAEFTLHPNCALDNPCLFTHGVLSKHFLFSDYCLYL